MASRISGARHWAGVSFPSAAPSGREAAGSAWSLACAADGVGLMGAGSASGVITALPWEGRSVSAGAVPVGAAAELAGRVAPEGCSGWVSAPSSGVAALVGAGSPVGWAPEVAPAP
ncbi:hypothetical protein, partial [Aeromonas sanarellii]|uniref:hypothetical protein n=1 Tax=Aeromonas sanarellii TaxID=633415 RepID=UPI003B9F1881